MSNAVGFSKIDYWMGKYYESMYRNDYFDENDTGKFKAFVVEQEFDEDDINDELEQGVDDCGYIDFVDIDDFPFPQEYDQKEDDDKKKFIFDKIKECYYHNTNLAGLQSLDTEHLDEAESKIIKACSALQRYYYSLNTSYQRNLQRCVDDHGLDIEGELAAIDKGEYSYLIHVDENGESFPFPSSLSNVNDTIKLEYKFDVIKKCCNHSDIIFGDTNNTLYPKCLLSTSTTKYIFDITEQEFESVESIYSEQCKFLWHRTLLGSWKSWIYLTAISIKNKFDYMQNMISAFQRYKIDTAFNKRLRNINEMDQFLETSLYIECLKNAKMQIISPWLSVYATAYDVVKSAMKSYHKSIPLMYYRSSIYLINDSLEITTRYILSVITFIGDIISKQDTLQNAITPFHIDFVMAYTNSIPPRQGISSPK